MKLQLHLPHNFQVQISFIKDFHFTDVKSNFKKQFTKTKTNVNKLSPNHWYDGVWENLDYKI